MGAWEQSTQTAGRGHTGGMLAQQQQPAGMVAGMWPLWLQAVP